MSGYCLLFVKKPFVSVLVPGQVLSAKEGLAWQDILKTFQCICGKNEQEHWRLSSFLNLVLSAFSFVLTHTSFEVYRILHHRY